MAAPLSDDEKDQIIRLLGEGLSYADIARTTGRSHGTVGRVAQSIGHRSGQTNLTRAHEARSAFCAERRAQAAATAQETVDRLLAEFFDSRPVVAKDGEGMVVTLTLPPDWKGLADMAKAVNLLQRTVIDVDRHDRKDDEGLAAVDAWLRDVMGSAS